jgi:hypothetical protein
MAPDYARSLNGTWSGGVRAPIREPELARFARYFPAAASDDLIPDMLNRVPERRVRPECVQVSVHDRAREPVRPTRRGKLFTASGKRPISMLQRLAVAVGVMAALVMSGCSATTAPTPTTAGPASAPMPDGLGSATISLGEIALVLPLPLGRTAVPLPVLRASLTAQVASLTGPLADMADGASNRSTTAPWCSWRQGRLAFPTSPRPCWSCSSQGTAASLRPADRTIAEDAARKSLELVERQNVSSGLGPASRLRLAARAVAGTVASQTIHDVIRLADGRTLTIWSTSVL